MRSLGRVKGVAGRKTITATPRQLESLIRISEALARMRHSHEVTEQDVDEALRLHKVATMAAATDPRTGAIDLDSINVGSSSAQRAEVMAQANALPRQVLHALPARKGRNPFLEDRFSACSTPQQASLHPCARARYSRRQNTHGA